MDNNEIAYISKEDCEKRGLIKLETGGYYKLNTIEKYAINGYLDGAKYDAITLLSTANTFYEDYYTARIDKLSAIDPSKIMVDGQGNSHESKIVSEATDRYNKAIKILPKKMLNIVKRVCCEDKEITTIPSINKHLKCIYFKLLILGLSLLTKHYNETNHKINKCLFYK
jgi:hypothetical protein